jgi:TetR/AcrR family tetracycline transcriptional repressor
MDDMTPPRSDDHGQRGLSRDRLVEAALALIGEEGLDGLSMRSLADRLDVKAASIYWHVRDRSELLELLAESILDSVRRPRTAAGWREAVVAITDAMGERVASQKDAARILLEVPDVLARSDIQRELRSQLVSAGLGPAEAADVSLMVMSHVIWSRPPETPAAAGPAIGTIAELAIDTGSRGVMVRAGGYDMDALVRLPADRSAAAPAVIRGETVVVRRLRGVGRGELELNPRRAWRFHVQAPTWNTLLDLGGLDVRAVHIDSGAAKVEIFLPQPSGVVPIHISSGVVDVALHRPRGTAALADLSTGAVQVRLDDFSTQATVFDTHWETVNASASAGRFQLRVSSGAFKVRLDEYSLKETVGSTAAPPPDSGAQADALDILLDGVQARMAARRRA